MKLSPPASSSDLETARGIARRLHQQRRRGDRPELGAYVATPGPVLRSPEAAPATDVAIDPLAGFGEPAPAPDEGDGGVPDIEVEEPPVSPEEMVGTAEPPLEDLPEPEPDDVSPPSPFDVDLDETAVPEEEVIDAPAPPSWDDLAEACLGLAQARGAMLVDPAGRVFAARGEWPEPGPDAIAAKLVATMDRTLKDAPTRSISAPLMGKHLTAWRVPLPEGLVTAAFIGDTPVRAEARPAIDTEIHRGAGA